MPIKSQVATGAPAKNVSEENHPCKQRILAELITGLSFRNVERLIVDQDDSSVVRPSSTDIGALVGAPVKGRGCLWTWGVGRDEKFFLKLIPSVEIILTLVTSSARHK
jgi:hypothetical protein